MRNIPATRSGDEGGAQTKPNWKFYDSLCFLRDIFMPSTTYGNVGNNLETFENETGNDEQSPLPTTPPLPRIFSPTDCENKKKGPKSAKSDIGDKMLEMEQRKLDAILSMQQEEPKSDDHHFFLSLLPMIEPLSHIEKLRLRAKIQKVVLDHLEGPQQTNTQHSSSSGHGIHYAPDTSRSRFHPYVAANSRDPRNREARTETHLEPVYEQTGVHPRNDNNVYTRWI
ncbi:hypothetical protein GE061_002745 [Apolygus lucorum]|uniref:Uncharacterized protein n=1 Tax=Apolygus lucorum TaxID=248454 RepID=A0A6A4J798_APOLU|nr:hypothetical protein GE061_002745 [Apolygus lucorum]